VTTPEPEDPADDCEGLCFKFLKPKRCKCGKLIGRGELGMKRWHVLVSRKTHRAARKKDGVFISDETMPKHTPRPKKCHRCAAKAWQKEMK
jgi:hypothetical protein